MLLDDAEVLMNLGSVINQKEGEGQLMARCCDSAGLYSRQWNHVLCWLCVPFSLHVEFILFKLNYELNVSAWRE
jgi:hypothetical protein